MGAVALALSIVPSITSVRITAHAGPAAASSISTIASSSVASADEAHERFERGLSLYRDGAFEAAAAEFERAYEMSPSYKILYNLGLAYGHAGDSAASLRTFERYLRDGDGEIASERRNAVETEMNALERKVARLTVVVSVDGATVTVDDLAVGTSPMSSAVILNPGRHRVVASRSDAPSAAQQVTLASADARTVSLTLVPIVAPTAAVTASASAKLPAAEAPSRAGRSSGADASLAHAPREAIDLHPSRKIVGWSTAGALFVGGVVGGAFTLHASSRLADARGSASTSRAQLDALQVSTKRLALATDLMFGGSIAATGFSLYWTLFPEKGRPSDGPPVQVVVAPARVGLLLRF